MMILFKSQLLRHSSLTVGATIINGSLGFVFYIILARLIGTLNFGNILLALAMLVVVSDIADFGVNSAVVNFVSKHRKFEEKSYSYLLSALLSKMGFGVFVSIIFFFSATFLANVFFQKSDLIPLLQIASLGILGIMLFSFSTSYLQAMQQYRSWAFVLIGSNLMRILVLLILWKYGLLTATSALVSFVAMPYLFFFISFLFLPIFKIFRAKGDIGKTFRALFSFSFWIGGSNVLWAILSRADTFLLGRLVVSFELGIYGLVSQLTVAILQLISAFAAVLAPKFASFLNKKEMHYFLMKSVFVTAVLSVFIACLVPVGWFFIPVILGSEYAGSLGVFTALFTSALLLLMATPFHEAIRYFFEKPQIFLAIYSIQLLLLIGFGVYFTDRWGVLGMSFAVLIANTANLLLSIFYYIKLLKR